MTLLPTGQPIDLGDFTVQPNNQLSPMPFVWGAGGARLTPEQILAQRAIANRDMQSDFSPVSSVWEGLGRVVNNVSGALENRNLMKQDAANAQEDRTIAAALLRPGADPSAALTNPYASKQTQELAAKVWDRNNPKPRAPFEFEGLLAASGLKPGTLEYQAAANKLLTSRNDPFVTANLPSGDFYAGPQSQFGTYLSGQGAVPKQAVGGPAIGTVEDGYRFKGGNPADRNAWEKVGGPTQPASGGFRPGR